MKSKIHFFAVTLVATLLIATTTGLATEKARGDWGLRVGAAIVDVSPIQLPVLINGGMTSRSADQIRTPVNARTIVIADNKQRIALVVVDSCMIPKELIDDAKQRAAKRTKLLPDKIMISATHTHSAPSAFGALGTDADLAYLPLLRERIVESLVQAEANLRPARIGWGSGDAGHLTALRRWIRRPDRVENDPFGNPTVRANMHAARVIDNVTGPSGPEDPELSMIAMESLEGEPIAVLANFSMHYYSDSPISADYFGLFCNKMQDYLSARYPAEPKNQVVVALSHGCSGDIWRRDYSSSEQSAETTIESYTDDLLKVARKTYEAIPFKTQPAGPRSLAMQEVRLPMKYRVPDQQRLHWAQQIVATLDGRLPKTSEEIYAREQVFLHELQTTTVVVQAMRIGNMGIVTTPNETYALSGLKLKQQSPLARTMVIELANGADGYIPPPEQHYLGGYNTWAARSAGLEEQAEPRIVAAGLRLLEQVSGQPRKPFRESTGQAAQQLLTLGPLAYWRMAEMEGQRARDASGNHRDGIYEPGVVFFLEGEPSLPWVPNGEINRCAHFAGGRMRVPLDSLGDSYSIAMSFWNGMPSDARETTGWLFSRDSAASMSESGEHLGIGGTATQPGKIVFQFGLDTPPLLGRTEIARWTWNHVLLVRDGNRVAVFLNGNPEPEIAAEIARTANSSQPLDAFIGGRSDNQANFEGRIDEVAVFEQVLKIDQLPILAAD